MSDKMGGRKHGSAYVMRTTTGHFIQPVPISLKKVLMVKCNTLRGIHVRNQSPQRRAACLCICHRMSGIFPLFYKIYSTLCSPRVNILGATVIPRHFPLRGINEGAHKAILNRYEDGNNLRLARVRWHHHRHRKHSGCRGQKFCGTAVAITQ